MMMVVAMMMAGADAARGRRTAGRANRHERGEPKGNIAAWQAPISASWPRKPSPPSPASPQTRPRGPTAWHSERVSSPISRPPPDSPQARLGHDGTTVSKVVLGGMSLTRARGLEAASRLVDEALERGIDTVDTAPLYDFGESERLLGELLATRRRRLSVLTKVGLRWDDDHGDVLFEADDARLGRVVVRRDGRPASIRREVEASLARLRLDTLGLVQIHQPDRHVPLADTLGALDDLRREGKLTSIGVSNFDRTAVEQAHRALDGRLAAVQCEYNLLSRAVEPEGLAAARSLGCGFLAYSPLAQGVLAGRMLTGQAPPTDYRRFGPLFAPANLAQIHAAMHASLLPIANAHHVPPGAIALSWLLGRTGVSAVVAGASEPRQLRELAVAAALELSPEQHARLDRSFASLRLDDPAAPSRLRRVLGRVKRRAMSWVGRRN